MGDGKNILNDKIKSLQTLRLKSNELLNEIQNTINEIKILMAEEQEIKIEDKVVVKWKWRNAGRFDTQRLKKEMPEVFNEYHRKFPQRCFELVGYRQVQIKSFSYEKLVGFNNEEKE